MPAALPGAGNMITQHLSLCRLRGYVFLKEAKKTIKPAETSKAIYNIFAQTVRKIGTQRMEKLLEVLDNLFKLVPIWDLGCNISDEAVMTSYNAMKPKED